MELSLEGLCVVDPKHEVLLWVSCGVLGGYFSKSHVKFDVFIVFGGWEDDHAAGLLRWDRDADWDGYSYEEAYYYNQENEVSLYGHYAWHVYKNILSFWYKFMRLLLINFFC